VANRAVFLDRDGTIVEDPGFLHEPEKVKLLPGAAEAIRRLNTADVRVVVVTNQSGIARGRYTVDDYEAVQRRLGELLAAHGARIDGAYFCPHHPQLSGPCDCRKPGLKLFRAAAQAFDIDFSRSCGSATGCPMCSRPVCWAAREFSSPRGRAICIKGRRARSV